MERIEPADRSDEMICGRPTEKIGGRQRGQLSIGAARWSCPAGHVSELVNVESARGRANAASVDTELKEIQKSFDCVGESEHPERWVGKIHLSTSRERVKV